MDIEKKEAFSNAINKCEVIHIFMHDHPSPDPDSIGSAVGLKKLLKDVFQKKAVIHGIPTDHRMNNKMVTELEITLLDPRDKKQLPDIQNEDHGIILVDCTLKSGAFQFTEHLGNKMPIWVMDHHPHKEVPTPEMDLQPVGSCATIISEYLQAFDVAFDPENKEDRFVATALMLGLLIDTSNLRSDDVDVKRDIDTFIYLRARYDAELCTRIMNYDYPKYFNEALQASFKKENQCVAEPYAVLTPGFIKEERLGVLSFVADYWIRVERLTMVVVFAVSGKELIASIRTKEGIRADHLVGPLFPSGTGGGKQGAARATVIVNGFLDLALLSEQGKQKFLDMTMETLVARIKKVIDLDE